MTTSLFACVLIHHFATHVARQARGLSVYHPLVISNTASERAMLVDVCPRARREGIHIGMSLAAARQRCPDLAVFPIDHQLLDCVTADIERILLEYADLVEQRGRGIWIVRLMALGINYKTAARTLKELHTDVEHSCNLPCQVGAGTNKMVAMIAAHKSQHRYVIVRPGDEQTFLDPLPLRLLPGAGQDTVTRCEQYGIHTVGQLAALNKAEAIDMLGQRGRTLHQRAQGHDDVDEPTIQHTIRQSWRCSGEPCIDHDQLHMDVRILTERAGRMLRRQQTAAGDITVRVTWNDGQTSQHTVRCVPRRDLDRDLAAITRQALDQLLARKRLAVIGLDVRLRDLGAVQRDLFGTDDSRPYKLQQALDTITTKRGTGAIFIGALARRLIRKRAA